MTTAFLALYGTDVSDVPVRRGRAVSHQAQRLDAAAFSRGGAVYLPDWAGPLSEAPAQALLAHELTHAVQQRLLGPALPAETSAEGQALERQALATQHWFASGAPAPSGARLAHVPVTRPLPSLPAADRDDTDDITPTGGHGVQRQPTIIAPAATAIADEAPDRLSWQAPWLAQEPATEPAQQQQDSPAIAAMQAEIARLREVVDELADKRLLDLDDPVELDELASRIYHRLRSRLRLELIVDRERAGLLTDFR